MDKPAEQQIRELVEWCGFEEILDSYTQAPTGRWRVPNGGEVNGKTWCYLSQLPIDLNSLFLYAVPKVGFCQLHKNPYDPKWHATVCLEDDVTDAVFLTNKDPALALFWALSKIMEENK